jgi:hypothetical protein
MPLTFPKTQLPPMRSEASKTVTSSPFSRRPLAAVIPEAPAPIRAQRGSGLDMPRDLSVEVDAGVTLAPCNAYVNVQL